jgi:hypothetical protein
LVFRGKAHFPQLFNIPAHTVFLPGGLTVFGRAIRPGKSLWPFAVVRAGLCGSVAKFGLSFCDFIILLVLFGINEKQRFLKSMLNLDEPKIHCVATLPHMASQKGMAARHAM